MSHALRAGGAVAGISFLTAFGALVAGAGAQNAQACARPNVPATAIHPALPDTPPIGQQQGITGTVQVVVSLDANSRVVGTRIQSSPSAILNNAALSAARASVFQTEIRNCVPIASDLIFNVQFDDAAGRTTTVGGGQRPIAVVTGQGLATRPPDVAYVGAGIVTSDDDPLRAAAQNDAIYTVLRTNLKTLGVDATAIRSTYFGVTLVPPNAAPANRASGIAQRNGYVAGRQVTATLDDVTKAGAVVDAMRSAGATSITAVQFALRDRRPAYYAALAAALEDAAAQGHEVARASRMHVAGIQTIRVGETPLGPPTPPPALNPLFAQNGPAFSSANLRPVPVEVRALATVTYVMEP